MIKLIFIVWVTVYPCGVIMAPPVFIVLHESGNAVHKHQRSAQWSFPAWRNHTNSMKYSTRTIARWFKKKNFFCKWVIKHHHHMSEHLRCILHLECKKGDVSVIHCGMEFADKILGGAHSPAWIINQCVVATAFLNVAGATPPRHEEFHDRSASQRGARSTKQILSCAHTNK